MHGNNDKTDANGGAIAVTPEMLSAMGIGDVAYVRPQQIEGRTVHLIFSANGQQIGGYENRDVAFAACRQNDLEPLSVH